jgi:hypothetical protein
VVRFGSQRLTPNYFFITNSVGKWFNALHFGRIFPSSIFIIFSLQPMYYDPLLWHPPTLRHAHMMYYFINISHQIGCTPPKSFRCHLTITILRIKSRVTLVEPSFHILLCLRSRLPDACISHPTTHCIRRVALHDSAAPGTILTQSSYHWFPLKARS